MKCLSILLMFFMFIMSSGRAEAREPRYSSRYAPPYLSLGNGTCLKGRRHMEQNFHWGNGDYSKEEELEIAIGKEDI